MKFNLKRDWQSWSVLYLVPFFLAALPLVSPLSSTGKSILLSIATILILFTPAYRASLQATLSQPWCQASLLLLFVALCACLWSPASMGEKLLILEKYSKLLYLPILVVGFQNSRTRTLALHAFLLAMVITCTISVLKFFAVTNYNGISADYVFRSHIVTSYMMAFAAYISALLGIRTSGWQRCVYSLMVLFFSYQILFINTGRTGYLTYLILMILLFAQTLTWRQAGVAIIFGCSVFGGVAYKSTAMHKKIAEIFKDIKDSRHNDNSSSIGTRIQFHKYAKNLYQRHPIIGNGTGAFTYLYRLEKPIPTWYWKLLEPHSQYWLVASEFGLVGLLALGLFFGSLFIAAWRLKNMRSIAIAALLSFMVANVSDSFLLYSGTGFFFILFMAICLGESKSVRKRKTQTITEDFSLKYTPQQV